MKASAVPAPPARLPIDAAAAATLTLIFWSGTVIANRYAVAYMDALTVGTFRSMIAGFVALGIAFAFRLPFPKTGRHRGLLLYSGCTNFAIWPMLLSVGIGLSNASHAALIMALLPVTTGLIAAIVNRTKPKIGWWIGATLAIMGTAFLVIATNSSADLTLSPRYLLGDLIILLGVIVCASGYVAGAKLSPVIGSWASTFYGLGIALIILVPTMGLLWADVRWGDIPTTGWTALGWLAFLSSLAGYALWFLAMDRGGIARIAVWQFGQPILSLLAAALILGESITWPLLVAAIAIVAGIVIAQRNAG
jgi:drug/metabolite transporter (DMT)-like permease